MTAGTHFRVWAPDATRSLARPGRWRRAATARVRRRVGLLRRRLRGSDGRHRIPLSPGRRPAPSPIRPHASSRMASMARRRVVDPRGFNWKRHRLAGHRAGRARHLRAARRHVYPGGHVCRRRRSTRVAGAPRRHRDRADAGGRFPGPLELGIRRRLAVCAGALLRVARRPASAGRSRPRRSGWP